MIRATYRQRQSAGEGALPHAGCRRCTGRGQLPVSAHVRCLALGENKLLMSYFLIASMSPQTFLVSALLAVAMFSPPAHAQPQRVRLVTASHLPQPSDVATIYEQDVLVKVGFNCPQNAINIFLKGVKLVDLGAPTGFRAAITVRSNGDVVNSHSAGEVRIDELATPAAGVSVIGPPH